MLAAGNLFANIPEHPTEEDFTILAELPGARIERIVSTCQSDPLAFGTTKSSPNGSSS